MTKKETIYIEGVHCRACKILLEDEIKNLAGIKSIDLNYQTGECKIEYNEEEISQEKIFSEIKKLNYLPSAKKTTKNKILNFKFLLTGVGIFLFAAGYFLVESLGGFELLAQLNESSVSYGLIAIIGVLSGFHCVSMCGGLVVAYSACQKTEEKSLNISSHLSYNLGRIISYTTVGALLGGVGSFFAINPNFTGSIMILASMFMILMGLSFLTNLPILEKIKLLTPDFIARYIYKQKQNNNKTPFVIGLLTAFMPCGPLQAIQLYALSTGNITQGALSLAIYGIGTSLMMLIFGLTISSISIQNVNKLIKFSGVLVIVLGIVMLNRGLANFNLGLNFGNSTPNIIISKDSNKEYQEIRMELNTFGYSPNVLYLEPSKPVRWIIDVKRMTGCTDAIMIESLGIERDLKYGENIIEFDLPKNVSEIKFSCWMRMVWGKFIISNKSSKTAAPKVQASIVESGSSCGGNCGGSSCGARQGGTCACGN